MVYRGDESQLSRARTVTFAIAAFSQLFFTFGCRSQRYTMPELGVFSNLWLFAAIAISSLLQLTIMTLPFTQTVFAVSTHLTWEWLLIIALSMIPVTVIEVQKLIRANWRR